MKHYVVTLMRDGSSTYWSEISAESAEEAVESYINLPPAIHPGAQVVQGQGGLVVVGEKPFGAKVNTINGYGISIFRVAPGPKPQPKPLERAHIVEQVTS